jgi:ribosomal protein S27E
MKRLTYEYVKNQLKIKEYKLLSKIYKNNKTKLKVECPEGHQYEVTYHHFQKGIRCLLCVGTPKHSYEYIKQHFENEGYKLISKEYIGIHKKIKIECPFGHQYEATYHNFQRGKRCPICWELKSHSRSEKSCLNIVKQLIPDETIIENDRTQIINPNTNKFLELDIYIPSLNKAIEFNGEYWHNDDYSKFKDMQKVDQCKEIGIDLLIVWYQDWVDNRKEQIEKINEFIEVDNV